MSTPDIGDIFKTTTDEFIQIEYVSLDNSIIVYNYINKDTWNRSASFSRLVIETAGWEKIMPDFNDIIII